MTDKLSPEKRSQNMRQIKSKGMKPEVVVRKVLSALGFRYRLHYKNLPGKPDIVFPGKKIAIFIHGCFWHQHKDPECKIARLPKSNKDYWLPKLERNVERDKENIAALTGDGWQVIIIWECETRNFSKIKELTIKRLEEALS